MLLILKSISQVSGQVFYIHVNISIMIVEGDQILHIAVTRLSFINQIRKLGLNGKRNISLSCLGVFQVTFNILTVSSVKICMKIVWLTENISAWTRCIYALYLDTLLLCIAVHFGTGISVKAIVCNI